MISNEVGKCIRLNTTRMYTCIYGIVIASVRLGDMTDRRIGCIGIREPN